jgi:hypothetical protein
MLWNCGLWKYFCWLCSRRSWKCQFIPSVRRECQFTQFMVRSTYADAYLDADLHRQLFRRAEWLWRRRSNVQLLDAFVLERRRRPPPYGLTDPSHSATSSRSNSRKTCTHILHPHLPHPQSSVSTNVQKVEKLDIWQKLNTGVASAAPLDWIIFCHLHKHLYTRRSYHERRELIITDGVNWHSHERREQSH